MNAPTNRTIGNQETLTIREKSEMKATDNGQNIFAGMHQQISKFKEDIAMNLSMIITRNTPPN